MDVASILINAAIVSVGGLIFARFMKRQFEALNRHFDARFDRMDRRFDAIDARFEVVDQRVDGVVERLERKVDKLGERLERRVDGLDRRMEAAQASIDAMRSELRRIALAVGVSSMSLSPEPALEPRRVDRGIRSRRGRRSSRGNDDQRFDRLEEKLGEGSTASRSESIAGSTGWSADVTSGTPGAGRRRTRGLGARYSAREGEGRGPRRR